MLQSITQLAKSDGDDLGLEYLWNGDETSFKAIDKNAEYRVQQEVSALVHVVGRPITVHYGYNYMVRFIASILLY